MMRKIRWILWVVLLLLILSGCNSQSKNELRILIKYDVGEKELYTPNSYDEYNSAKSAAKDCLEEFFLGSARLNEAKNQLQEKMNALTFKADKSSLIEIIEKAQAIEEKKYTTVSYQKLQAILTDGLKIRDDENALQQTVDETIKKLKETINDLELAQKGVYEIYTVFDLHFNDSVGNEWKKEISYNGRSLKSEDEIIAGLDETIVLSGKITEQDQYSDIGIGNLRLDLGQGQAETIEIIVRESKGRYAGNIAIWKMECRAILKERI